MRDLRLTAAALSCVAWTMIAPAAAQPATLSGAQAFGDWRRDSPGTGRLIRPQDLPKPGATASVANGPRIVARPRAATPQVPVGFTIDLIAQGLSGPRIMRVAPNGDIFVAETGAGRIRVLRVPPGGSQPTANAVYASGLSQPFGMAFYPEGPDPKWLYVANTDSVVRFPYRGGDLEASGSPQIVVAELPDRSGHSTRDLVFTADGKRMLVSVGSASNAAEGMTQPPGGLPAWSGRHPLGASWGLETDRADVLAFDPDGNDRSVFATGIRNCSGLAVQPANGALWCATNERDGLGDDLVPDYVTRLREGAFYGWPWYYIGANEDPRHRAERPDLRDKITVPDVLLQPHSAPLELVFYHGDRFPPEFRGDAFVALHGSWNRSRRTGYKIARIPMKDGLPTGEYQDFVTGFVAADDAVWGRPVGVAVTRDGALLLCEDGNGTIWRVSH